MENTSDLDKYFQELEYKYENTGCGSMLLSGLGGGAITGALSAYGGIKLVEMLDLQNPALQVGLDILGAVSSFIIGGIAGGLVIASGSEFIVDYIINKVLVREERARESYSLDTESNDSGTRTVLVERISERLKGKNSPYDILHTSHFSDTEFDCTSFFEHHDKFFEPINPLFGFKVLPNGKRIIAEVFTNETSRSKKEKINVYSYDREMLPKEDLSEIISESIGSSANSKNIWY